MDPVSNVSGLAQVAELLKANDKYLIVPHVQPDPDAFGSTFGLALLLRKLGKTVEVFCDEAMPANCRNLARYFTHITELPADAPDWKLLFLDGGEQHRQLKTMREWKTWLNLDHHLDNGQFAEWIYVDTHAAATSLIVGQLAPYLGVALDEASASCLFSGILFDTRGGFITDRCDGALFRVVADLVDAGAKPDVLNREANEQMSLNDFTLYGQALADLKTAAGGAIVYAVLTRAMLDAAGGDDQAMEMLTQHLPKVAGGEVYILFKESEPGLVKVSLRSKGRIAVNTIAKQFGGGGHKFAAGARFELPMAEAVATLVAASDVAVREQLAALA